MAGKGVTKKRGSSTYNRKVFRMEKWHARMEENKSKPAHVNPNTGKPAKRTELKPLDFYLDKIKKVKS